MRGKRYLFFSMLLSFIAIFFLLILNITQQKQIQFGDVCNMDLTDAYSEEMGASAVNLEYGQFRKDDDIYSSLSVSMPYTKGDFNGNLLTDYAFVMFVGGERGRDHCDLVLVENQQGNPVFVGKNQLDICDPTSLEITHNQIILNNHTRSDVTEIYELVSGQLTMTERIEIKDEP